LNPEPQMRELKEVMAKNEAAQSVNIMYELEREFNRVFAGASEAAVVARRDRGGNPAIETAVSQDTKRFVE